VRQVLLKELVSDLTQSCFGFPRPRGQGKKVDFEVLLDRWTIYEVPNVTKIAAEFRNGDPRGLRCYRGQGRGRLGQPMVFAPFRRGITNQSIALFYNSTLSKLRDVESR
jgi:hypothetical protein